MYLSSRVSDIPPSIFIRSTKEAKRLNFKPSNHPFTKVYTVTFHVVSWLTIPFSLVGRFVAKPHISPKYC